MDETVLVIVEGLEGELTDIKKIEILSNMLSQSRDLIEQQQNKIRELEILVATPTLPSEALPRLKDTGCLKCDVLPDKEMCLEHKLEQADYEVTKWMRIREKLEKEKENAKCR
jgi:hypothetical protein